MEHVTVLGAGAWGTTLAWMLARQGHPVRLWCLEEDLAEEMRQVRHNRRYRPEIELPSNLEIFTDLGEALSREGSPGGADVVVAAVPSRWLRQVLQQAQPHLQTRPFLLSATKGLEEKTGQRISQVIADVLGEDYPLAALSGPNLSAEIAREMPAVSVSAATDPELAALGQRLLSSPLFRVYRNYDIIGVELCGALKNVIAVGAGISDGLDYGANAKAALITRGLAEMCRLGTRLGARAETFWGVAGVGDLVATANSRESRNWNLGYQLARGRTWEEVRESSYSVVEGVYTAVAARRLGRELNLALPITEALCQILFEGVPVAQAVRALMTRPERAEAEE
jgi:glycerol-3-phosphate dehydrogenase (NAD(P)+)